MEDDADVDAGFMAITTTDEEEEHVDASLARLDASSTLLIGPGKDAA